MFFYKTKIYFLMSVIIFLTGCSMSAPIKKVNDQTKKLVSALEKINNQGEQIQKSVIVVNKLADSMNNQSKDVEKILNLSGTEKQLVSQAGDYVSLIYDNTYKMTQSFDRQVVINKTFYNNTKKLSENLKKGEKENSALEKLLQEAVILNK